MLFLQESHAKLNSLECMNYFKKRGVFEQIEDLYEVIRRIMGARKLIDSFVQVLPSGSYYSVQQLVVGNLSFFLYMHICMPSELKVTEAPQVAQLVICTRCQSHIYTYFFNLGSFCSMRMILLA